MPLTKGFREIVAARASSDPAYRAGLFQEAIQEMLSGELVSARLLLRDFINATVGFAAVADRVNVGDKSLMRMFGPEGNPTADNLLAVLAALRDACDLKIVVSVKPSTESPASRIRKVAEHTVLPAEPRLPSPGRGMRPANATVAKKRAPKAGGGAKRANASR